MRERHDAIDTRFACSPEAVTFDLVEQFAAIYCIGCVKNLKTANSRGRRSGSDGRYVSRPCCENTSRATQCGTTAMAFRRMVVFEAAIELGLV